MMRHSFFVSAALIFAVAGCQAQAAPPVPPPTTGEAAGAVVAPQAVPAARTARIQVITDVVAGRYFLQAVIGPYTRADVHHVDVELQNAAGTTTLASASLLNADIGNPVSFTELKRDTTYRVVAKAYLSAGSGEQLSLDDGQNVLNVPVGNDDFVPVSLKVNLKDRVFTGNVTSNGVTVTPGLVSDTLNPAAIAIGTRTYSASTFAGGAAGYTNGASAQFTSPRGLALDVDGNLYVADWDNHTIRKIAPDGTTSTVAGTNATGNVNGTAALARFWRPFAVALDSNGVLYVAEDGDGHKGIRKIDLNRPGTDAQFVTTFATTGYTYRGLAVDAVGNVYATEAASNQVIKFSPSGTPSLFAGGAASEAGFAEGTGSAARFTAPQGLGIDRAGNLYVADAGNHRIRKITPEGVVTTLAGGTAGFADGTGAAARFNEPYAVDVDINGTVFVADRVNASIRRVTAAGVVTTIAGGGVAGFQEGTSARFQGPTGIVLDRSGRVVVSDTGNHRIRRLQ